MAHSFIFNAGCSEGSITSYTWDFGDGTSGTGVYINKSYVAGEGPWTVTLTIVGPGGTSITSAIVTAGGSGASTAPATVSLPQTGEDPQVMLRVSNDGGRTWVSSLWRSAGRMGEYRHRVRWNGLGSARRRVFEMVMTDPIPWRLVGSNLQISQGQPAAGQKVG